MPRPTRDQVINPENPNHIVVRGNNRRRLFSYPRDYESFLWLFARANHDHDCSVHALCVMTNHAHDLTTPPSVAGMSECVKGFAQRYAQLRNTARGATGKLFEQRYYSKPIADDAHMLAAMMYIEANPIRAGLVTDAADYPWSTHALHVGFRSAIPRTLWTPSRWYLALGHTDAERARTYRELFADYIARGMPDEEDRFVELSYLDKPYTRRLLRPNGTRAAEPASNGFVRFAPDAQRSPSDGGVERDPKRWPPKR